MLETSDNRYLSPGQVGVWSQGAQVNIRRFSVSAIGNDGEGDQSQSTASTQVAPAIHVRQGVRLGRRGRELSIAA